MIIFASLMHTSSLEATTGSACLAVRRAKLGISHDRPNAKLRVRVGDELRPLGLALAALNGPELASVDRGPSLATCTTSLRRRRSLSGSMSVKQQPTYVAAATDQD